MQRRTKIYLAVAALIFGASLVAGYFYYENVMNPPVPSGDSEPHGSGGYEVEDRRKVVGVASNVFVGTVESQSGSVGLPMSGPGDESIPMAQYTVTVEQDIKGDLPKSVTVNALTYDDDPTLTEGSRYLFAAEPNLTYDLEDRPIGEGWYVVHYPGFDHIEVKSLDHQLALVASFTTALRNQIVPDPFE